MHTRTQWHTGSRLDLLLLWTARLHCGIIVLVAAALLTSWHVVAFYLHLIWFYCARIRDTRDRLLGCLRHCLSRRHRRNVTLHHLQHQQLRQPNEEACVCMYVSSHAFTATNMTGDWLTLTQNAYKAHAWWKSCQRIATIRIKRAHGQAITKCSVNWVGSGLQAVAALLLPLHFGCCRPIDWLRNEFFLHAPTNSHTIQYYL